MQNLSIIHIEDEYREFLSLSTTVKTMIEDFWQFEKKQSVVAKRREVARSADVPQNWVVYEMVVDEQPEQKFRYIFIRDAVIPAEVSEYIFENSIFILDVLRPLANSTVLGISVEESLEAIKPYVKDHEHVVLFTAHQGSGLDVNNGALPRKISKESDGELEKFLASVITDCF